MEGELEKPKEGSLRKISILLELSASDDLTEFRRLVEEEGFDIDEVSLWYGRSIGSKKMDFHERTPIMIAALFGSKKVFKYILASGQVDINMARGSDKVTALHCATAGGSTASLDIFTLLVEASADVNSLDAYGNQPRDIIPPVLNSSCNSMKKRLKTPHVLKDCTEKKVYPIDLLLPDLQNGPYGTDEFRMYTFKVKPCSRAGPHNWKECPFIHPGETARRRDPRKYQYSCVLCPEFQKGTCRHGDTCEYAHGVFERCLHPTQYRTRLCKDEMRCIRKVCFFAHTPEDLRRHCASTGSVVPSPRSSSTNFLTPYISAMSPFGEYGQFGWLKRRNLGDESGTLEPSVPSQLQAFSMKIAASWGSYPSYSSSSPVTMLPSYGLDPYGSTAESIMNSRSLVFAKRSQSFIDHRPANYPPGFTAPMSGSFIDRPQANYPPGFTAPMSSSSVTQSTLSDWGSSNGELNWSIREEELNKLRKSSSFGFRSSK